MMSISVAFPSTGALCMVLANSRHGKSTIGHLRWFEYASFESEAMRSPVTFYAGCIGHFQVGRFSFLQMERGLGPLPTVEIQRLKVIRVVQGL
jgi:hypothetical protein